MKEIVNTGFELFFLVLGLIFLIFNKSILDFNIKKRIGGSSRKSYSERDRKITRVMYILGGILFSGMGILMLLDHF